MSGIVPYNNHGLKNRDNFYSMIDDFFTDPWLSRKNMLSDTFKLDVKEYDKEYLIDAEMPGIDKKDIDVEMHEGKLNISVSEKNEKEEEEKNYVHRERRYSSMQRSVYLPDAKNEGIEASLENGILKIKIPKDSGASDKKKIDIK